jgi:DNA-binding Lrp family transcriptional regulator
MMLDLLDRKIAHALQLDGRAPFKVIGTALGVSDQTVARRYRKLRSAGALRVLGLTDARRLGHVEWLVRLRCVPSAAEPIAAALAGRQDTSWVSLTSGGTEIVCFTRTRGHQPGDSQLLGKLPRTPRVVAVTAHCLLRMFFGGATGWNGRADALTPEEIQHLQATTPPQHPSPGHVDLTAEDEPLLAELSRDGRASYRTLAAATGWSESTVHRRLEHLRNTGALFFDVDINPGLLGFTCEAMLWLSVPPTRLADLGATLATHPEVAFAAATTGPTNLVASVGCHDVDALYDYIATRLGALDAISHIETAPVIHSVKRAGAIIKP